MKMIAATEAPVAQQCFYAVENATNSVVSVWFMVAGQPRTECIDRWVHA